MLGGLAQSVALYAAGAAVALGAGRVLYLDDDADRRARAVALGAEAAPLADRDPTEQFEIVCEGTGHPAALAFAIRSTARNGSLTSVAIHLGATTPVPLTEAYYKGLHFETSRVDARAHLPAVLDCCAQGRFKPDLVRHRTLSFADAADAMADPGPKLVFVP